MGFFDFLFRKSNNLKQESTPNTGSILDEIEPFVFVSNCHQRYEDGLPVMGLQQCMRTVRLERNTNGCKGYRLNPGDGYVIKIFNDDLGKPNMSDKPMRLVSKTTDKIEFRGFPIEAQSPFGWQEVDYSDYGFVVHLKNGNIDKCVLYMYDRNTYIEYRKRQSKPEPKFTKVLSVKSICEGIPFELKFEKLMVIKQYYNQRQETIELSENLSATLIRSTVNGGISVKFSNIDELKQKGIIQSNQEFHPNFNYQKDEDHDEFASAEINNSFAAMSSGREYVTLFQITKQKGKFVSFIINNLPNVDDYYYLIIMQ